MLNPRNDVGPSGECVSIEKRRSTRVAPTAQDIRNFRIREEIARWQEEQYTECLTWALKAFGPGWIPSHRHFLVEKDEEERHRRTGDVCRAAATVYTVKNETGERRHFTISDAGEAIACEGYEAGFGQMLLESHPTRGFEHQGRFVHCHRYSLCWAPYELYKPKSPEQLAALRATREQNKEQREDERWAEEHPLFAQAGMKRADLLEDCG